MTAHATENKYDTVPYSSFPYPNTSPERLFTIGKLFGTEPVDFKKCKVLELGCASGGNIIPMATMFPNSSFVGIDFSEVQIKQGQENINALGLKNITLKTMSITDISTKFGKFDYIIVHGILSWVPKNVQDKIFEVCSNNLTKNGIAYISYNTLPGWNAIRSIREMMQFHTANFTNPADKVREARLLLKFIKDANTGNKSAYAQVIETEIATLNNCDDSYLLHDHLEDVNEPFYFHEIAEKAGTNGLQYLGDTSIASMFPGNFPGETASILAQATNDIVKVEQYMDFLRNRRFRSSLFCHKEVTINRNLHSNCLENFYLTANINATEDLNNIDITTHKELQINFANGTTLTTSNPAMIVAVREIINQKGKPIATKDLLNKIFDITGPSANKDAVRNLILDQLLRLVLTDSVAISSYAGDFITEVSTKPKVSELARHQARNNNWITNQRAEKNNIDLFNRVLLQYLDGGNDFNSIVEKMLSHIEKGDLSINVNGETISDKKQIEEFARNLTKQTIENLAPLALLVA